MYRRLLNAGIILAVMITTFVFVIIIAHAPPLFYGDSLGYYMYLPAAFIYHNLDHIDQLPKDKGIDDGIQWYASHIQDQLTPNGRVLDQYTYGIALMELPFFLLAHAYEKAAGLPANGYSYTYNYLIKVSAFLYALLGLMLLYKILRRYFD